MIIIHASFLCYSCSTFLSLLFSHRLIFSSSPPPLLSSSSPLLLLSSPAPLLSSPPLLSPSPHSLLIFLLSPHTRRTSWGEFTRVGSPCLTVHSCSYPPPCTSPSRSETAAHTQTHTKCIIIPTIKYLGLKFSSPYLTVKLPYSAKFSRHIIFAIFTNFV